MTKWLLKIAAYHDISNHKWGIYEKNACTGIFDSIMTSILHAGFGYVARYDPVKTLVFTTDTSVADLRSRTYDKTC